MKGMRLTGGESQEADGRGENRNGQSEVHKAKPSKLTWLLLKVQGWRWG